jgi:murein endopeptidase
MLTGHASHQLGIESDIWLMPMPDRRLTPEERNEMSAISVVTANGEDIDAQVWRPEHRKLLELAARDPAVNRIFVNPVIKRTLCREVTGDRRWLHRIRPWFGHNYHFHVRLACPPGGSRCRPATGAVPTSPGGSHRKRSSRNRPSRSGRCGSPTCRTPAPLWSSRNASRTPHPRVGRAAPCSPIAQGRGGTCLREYVLRAADWC